MPQLTHLSAAIKQDAPKSQPQPNPHGMTTFTGSVAVDLLHGHNPSPEIPADFNSSIGMVTFTPCARTYWHWHERGQLLTVTKGSGWVCDKGDKPKKIQAGDVVWCPPGTTHWHGADDHSEMMHVAFSMGGVEWYNEITDEEYAAKGQ